MMPSRIQPRRVARELALLSLSQLSGKPDKLETPAINQLVLAAVRTLSGEIQDSLETAAEEVKRGQERLLTSETRASTVASARAMIEDALSLTQTAINRLGAALELPEVVQLSSQAEVRQYAAEIIRTVQQHQSDIQQSLSEAMVSWQLERLPRLDRDILYIAVAEVAFLGLNERIAINEAVELAKRYSDDEGRRFINGVLRRVSDRRRGAARQGVHQAESP